MGNATYTLGHAPTISIARCDGDLTIEGHSDETVSVETDAMPHSIQDHERLRIEDCDDDLRLRVPRSARVSADRVDGDVRIEGLVALDLGRVSGDLELRAITSSCAVRGADGDVQVSDVANLSLGPVSGDAHLGGLTGRLVLERIEGDVELRGAVDGFGPVHVGSDLVLDTSFAPGQEYRITVDGDAIVYVPEDADLTLHATVHGDISGTEVTGDGQAAVATWGDGSAHLTLTVHGDLQVRSTGARGRRPVTTTAAPATASAAPTTVAAAAPEAKDAVLSVLEALARGDISPAEAEDLLARQS